MKLPALLGVLLLLSSCQASQTGSAGPHGVVRYSVKKSRPSADAAKPHFVVEISLSTKESRLDSHILVVYDAKWVTLNLGEAPESTREIEITEEGDEPLPAEVGKFSGKLLAVRCRDDKDDRVEVDLRVYEVQDGRIIAKERSKDSLMQGQTKELTLSW
jgi:hypothetical protein